MDLDFTSIKEIRKEAFDYVIQTYFEGYEDEKVIRLLYHLHEADLTSFDSLTDNLNQDDAELLNEGKPLSAGFIVNAKNTQSGYFNKNNTDEFDDIEDSYVLGITHRFQILFQTEVTKRLGVENSELVKLHTASIETLRKIQLIYPNSNSLKDIFNPTIAYLENEIRLLSNSEKSNVTSLTEGAMRLEVLDVWTYDREQLADLAWQLEQQKYVDSNALFLEAFCNGAQNRCNWKRSIRSFMYLMYLTFPITDNQRLLKLCDIFSERFTFKSKNTSSRSLRENLRNIETICASEKRYLGGDYLTLYEIHAAIFS